MVGGRGVQKNTKTTPCTVRQYSVFAGERSAPRLSSAYAKGCKAKRPANSSKEIGKRATTAVRVDAERTRASGVGSIWRSHKSARKRFPTHQDRERGDHYGGVAGPSEEGRRLCAARSSV